MFDIFTFVLIVFIAYGVVPIAATIITYYQGNSLKATLAVYGLLLVFEIGITAIGIICLEMVGRIIIV